MNKSESARFYSLMGVIFMIAGALILILSILNYLQDRRLSLTSAMGFVIISLGALWYVMGKKHKSEEK